MSDEVKLKWETLSRWLFRMGIFVMSVAFTISGNALVTIFSEMRADVKQLLLHQPVMEGKINAIEDRTARVESDLRRLQDSGLK